MKKKYFQEKLWLYGQQIGEISGCLTFSNLPILYQLKVGVLTKHGITFSSKPVLLDAGSLGALKANNPVTKFRILKDKLILSDTGRTKHRLTLYDKMQLFRDLSTLLHHSDKSSMISFLYPTESDLVTAQQHLIDLGLHCLEFAEYVEFD